MLAHVLTDKELELVLELLDAESHRVAIDMRRSDSSAVAKELRERLRAVDRLTERFHEFQTGDLEPE